jgi:hypothetical protein
MGNSPISILLNGLLSFSLGLALLVTIFRLVGHRVGLFFQLGVLAAVLAAVNVCNSAWWKSSLLQVHGATAWLSLAMFWGGLVYFYAIHFETITRDGGPTFMLFRYISESPAGERTRSEILDYFSDQSVLSDRIEALVRSGWLERTTTGAHVVTRRGRSVLLMLNGWIRLLGYPWGG